MPGWFHRTTVSVMISASVVGSAVPLARADDYVDRVNKTFVNVRSDLKSDTVLMPLLSKTEAPPAACDTAWRAMLLPAGSGGWPAAEAWAKGAPQVAALEGLRKVTKERDLAKGFAFSQPYGDQAVAGTPGGVDLIAKGFYTDLGDPPLLAGAKFGHMDLIQRLAALVHVEATRLAAGGDPKGAIALLVDWSYFGRQLIDRPFFGECAVGYGLMTMALERIRDVAYIDLRSGAPKLTAGDITAFLEDLKDDPRHLAIDRIELPLGDKAAAEQMIARTYKVRGKADPVAFAATMARMNTSTRPLRLFSESSKWAGVASTQVDWFDAGDTLTKVYNDWLSRWPLSPFDRRMSLKTDYEQMTPSRVVVVSQSLPDLGVLFNSRQVLRAHLVGTRTGLAIAAFARGAGSLPPSAASVVPKYIGKLDADPFNPERAEGKQPQLEYFVPIRDQTFGRKEEKKPHTISVFPPEQGVNFKMDIGEDQFVLYSRGPDLAKNWAQAVTMLPVRGFPGDILLWPPVTSLTRQELQRTGALK